MPVPYLSDEVGLSGMREAALNVSVAPAVMFVNVLSLLYMHACKSLLLEIEETGADFAVGQVGRCPPRRKKIRYPSARLFGDRMTIDGVERTPAFLTDGFVENKLFRRDFINEHQLAFDRALREPDRLFAIEAYLASKRVAVVPGLSSGRRRRSPARRRAGTALTPSPRVSRRSGGRWRS